MRIIGGKFRGKKILYTNSFITRPLRDYIKENIFNIITHGKNFKLNLEKTKILDLYSGVGSFGIECLSRNASKVVFIEKDPLAFSILKKNIYNLKIENRSELVFEDVEHHFEGLNTKEKFNLIFLDPPYKNITFLEVMNIIKEKKIFSKNHKVIIHRERKCDKELDKIINVELIKNYGRSKIIFGSF